MRRLVVVVLAAVLAASLAVPAVAASPTKNVHVGDFFFHPGSLTIKKGTKVTWKWVGFIQHNVRVLKGPAQFHSKTQVSGTFSHVFTKKGTYLLHCTIHPTQMKEKIIVK